MLKAVLLDLDNTMVLFDEMTFYNRYFEKLCRCFGDILPADAFTDLVLRSTISLGENNGDMSNRRFFLKTFMKDRREPAAHIWKRFMAFYETTYDEIAVEVSVPEGLNDVLDRLQKRAFKLVLASNPIYPRVALEKRMAWAGIATHRFQLVTHIENMSFVKPRPGYYRQVCEMIDTPPERCLMVGNDPVNDMAAASAGLKTFLTTDVGAVDYSSLQLTVAENVQRPTVPEPDFTGPFADVIKAVEDLKPET